MPDRANGGKLKVPIRKRFETREPTDYYGVVEEVVDADPNNARTRSFLLIDAVRADLFDQYSDEQVEHMFDRRADLGSFVESKRSEADIKTEELKDEIEAIEAEGGYQIYVCVSYWVPLT